MPDPRPKPDANEDAARAVRDLTDSEPESGEELLESPELQQQLRDAKRREAAREKSLNGR